MTDLIDSLKHRKQGWRWILPMVLLLLFLSVLIWLPWQAQQMESTERQEQMIADTLWVEQAIRFQLGRDAETVRLVGEDIVTGFLPPASLRERVSAVLRNNPEMYRLVWLDAEHHLKASAGGMWNGIAEFARITERLPEEHNSKTPYYTVSSMAPSAQDAQLVNYHVPMFRNDKYIGSLIASYRASAILEDMVPWWFAQDNEIILTDYEDHTLAKRMAGGAGHGVYTHRRELDLPGIVLVLHTNSIKKAPKLLPNLLVGSVMLLSLGLLWSLWALWRDINRRLAAEGALRQQVAFRSAMENSLVTGLRARDLEGRILYVNPAFCRMVGLPPEELLGKQPPMPYWAPEATQEYQERFAKVMAHDITSKGFETIYQRANGERFPVLLYEAPLLDEAGHQTGWMSSILDISDLRKIENINRQQSEKLQASARLSTMGELASTLAHELNQPLAAIASYLTGAINLIGNGNARPERLQPALEKANVQAQRAGHIIRSVHEYVKKREAAREPVSVHTLLQAVAPLLELQARQYYVTIQTSVQPELPPVLADRVMLEQVVLNLTRNAIEAMRDNQPQRRVLRIEAGLETTSEGEPHPHMVVSVIDQGHGIAPEVADRLYSPFFSTKAEGMGMGLNICRTTIEFHGGTLTHQANPGGGTIFRFTLPALAEEH